MDKMADHFKNFPYTDSVQNTLLYYIMFLSMYCVSSFTNFCFAQSWACSQRRSPKISWTGFQQAKRPYSHRTNGVGTLKMLTSVTHWSHPLLVQLNLEMKGRVFIQRQLYYA